MNALKLNSLYELLRLRSGLKARVLATATIGRNELTPRRRNTIIKALESGYLGTSSYRGTGLLAKQMLDAAGVFYVSKDCGLYWNAKLEPKGFRKKLQRLLTADVTATKVKGEEHYSAKVQVSGSVGCAQFYTMNASHHIPQLLAEYVATPEYKAAVKPFTDALKAGEDIVLTIQQEAA